MEQTKKIILFLVIVVISVPIVFFTNLWPSYVDFIVNILEKFGVKEWPIVTGVLATFVAVYAPIYLGSSLLGKKIRPYFVKSNSIKNKLDDMIGYVDEANTYISQVKSQLDALSKEKDLLEQEVALLESLSSDHADKLKSKVEVKFVNRGKERLYIQVSSFIQGVIASLAASFVWSYFS
ncbi:hypothetical protein L4D76_13030 [Photobacterium sagamiensis]|uniref:hypothetical protein n=1 Tax=Photobacterium sagamiensis TaxID=2910241 RepID=UPI003D0DD0E0